MPTTPKPNVRPHGRSSSRAIVGLVALFTALSASVALLDLRHLHALPSHTHLPWWALAIGFGLCEIFVVHVDRGRQTHTFSLMEIPLVVGLYLVSPLGLIAARLAGSGAALAVHRRQAPLKLAFNLSLFGLESAVAAAVFRGVAGQAPGVGPASWGAAVLASLVVNVIGAVGVTAVIAVTAGRLPRSTLRQMAVEGVLLGPLANTSLALCAAVLLWAEAAAAILLVTVAVVLFLAYRGYSSLSRRYANLQRLYEFTRETHRRAQDDDAITTILDAARRLLDAERAELVLVGGEGQGPAVRTRVEAGAEPVVEGPLDVSELEPAWEKAIGATQGLLIPANTGDHKGRELLARSGWRDLVAVGFQQPGDIVGAMVVADRAGDVSTFDQEDLALFMALVNHAVVTMEATRLMSRLQHEALHDSLTGLPNRALFNRNVDEALASRQPGSKLAVLLMDLDRFKEVNDTLGHHFGDQLLMEVGRRLIMAVSPDETVARLGGDEFAILLPNVENADCRQRARAIASALEVPFQLGDVSVDAAASIGIAISPDHGEDAPTLLQRADVAMYAAKSSAVVEVYAHDRDDHSTTRLALISELRKALADRAVEVWYQPQADARTGFVTGVEALIRWNHPDRGWIPPDEFIPVTERTGLIGPLTSYVLHEVALQWRAWNAAGYRLRVSVNLSMRNLQDPTLVDQVASRIAAVTMPPALLTLEITESSIMADPARTISTLERLAEAGVGLSIDDFGTGYSSLAYLRQLPVKEVKIDKSFVKQMETNPGDGAIVRSVIDLGRNLDLDIVAEGVESAAAWRQLADWGCSTIQGYHLSPPRPAHELTEWLAARNAMLAEAPPAPTEPPVLIRSEVARHAVRLHGS